MAPSFTLEPKSFTAPTDREPLRISFTTTSAPGAGGSNPIHPATRLQLSYSFGGGAVHIFSPVLITPRDVDARDGDAGVCSIAVPRGDMPLARVPAGASRAAEVTLHAWRADRLLGSRVVGEVEGLGVAA